MSPSFRRECVNAPPTGRRRNAPALPAPNGVVEFPRGHAQRVGGGDDESRGVGGMYRSTKRSTGPCDSAAIGLHVMIVAGEHPQVRDSDTRAVPADSGKIRLHRLEVVGVRKQPGHSAQGLDVMGA